jgi:hypothetical protein
MGQQLEILASLNLYLNLMDQLEIELTKLVEGTTTSFKPWPTYILVGPTINKLEPTQIYFEPSEPSN